MNTSTDIRMNQTNKSLAYVTFYNGFKMEKNKFNTELHVLEQLFGAVVPKRETESREQRYTK